MNASRKLREEGTGMGITVKTVTRWLKGPILLFGIYLVLYGHITPGGGFGGGVVIACSFILITLASGERAALSLFSKNVTSRLDSAGLLIFLALGWLGTAWAGAYFYSNFITTPEAAQFTLLSGGIMPMANIALGLKVASALFLVFTLLSAFKIVERELEDLPDPADQQQEGES
ncbi:MAG: MnhB domain-containing protein [Lysobacterales bacterium]|jgi:multicomponent Na+:H+ antiporter subunit B